MVRVRHISILLALMLTFAAAQFATAQTTFTGTGTWSNAGNWSAGVPTSGTAAIIDNNASVTVDVAAVAASLTLAGGNQPVTVTISGTNSLTIDGTIDMQAGTGNGDHRTIDVGAGSLSAASVTMVNTGGNGRDDIIIIGTGTVTISGDITMNGSFARNHIDWTGSGTLFVSGNISGGGLTPGGNGTVEYNGSGPSLLSEAYTYNNLTINKTSATATLGASLTIGGNLSVTSGTLDLSTFTANRSAAGGTISISSGATLRIGGTNSFPTNYTTQTLNAASTVEYNGTNQTIAVAGGASGYGNLTLSGTSTKSTPGGTTTTTVAGNFTLNSGIIYQRAGGATSTLTLNGTTNTVDGTLGSGANLFNTINVGNAGGDNLTVSSTGAVTVGTMTVTGTVTNNGAVTTTVALSGAGSLTQGSNSTLTLGGTFGITTLTATASGNTVVYNGTGAQTIRAISYHHLTSSNTNAAGATVASALTVGGNLNVTGTSARLRIGDNATPRVITVSGGVTVGTGATLIVNTASNTTHTLNVAGNFSNSGTVTLAPDADSFCTVVFNGSSSQTLTGSTTFRNLTINNSAGIVLSANQSVAGTLTFTSGNVTTGANSLILTSTGTVSRTSGHVSGNFQKNIPTGTPVNRTFELGTGTDYTPLDVSFASVSTAGNLTASTTSGDHPQIVTSSISSSKGVNRYWTLANAGIVFTNYSATFNFVAGDIDGGANTANFLIDRYSGGTWTPATVGTKTGTSTEATGLTAFGDFQIGELATLKTWDGGAATNNWGDANNWNPDGVPNSTHDVLLDGANTINVNVAADAGGVLINNASLVLTILSGNSLTVVSDFNMSNGTLNTEASLPTAGGYGLTGGTVAYTASSGSQTVAAVTYNNLTISGGGTKTLGGNIGVAGNLTVSGGTLDLSTFTADRTSSGGTLSVAAGLTLRIGGTNGFPANYTVHTLNATSTVEYYGSTQTVGNTTYGNLTLSGSGPKTTPGGTTTTTVAGSLTLNSGITYEAAASAIATLTLNGTTNTNDGTLGSIANPFATINVGNAGGDNLTNNNSINTVALDVTGSVTNNSTVITTGNLSGGGTFTQAANSQLFAGGNVTVNTLTATASPNTVTYSGTSAQSILGTTYHDLAIANSPATASLTSTATINNDLSISSGATMDIGAATILVSGATTISGTLNITNATGTKTFNDFTINGTGLYNVTVNTETVTFNGNFANNGTMTVNNSWQEFAGTGKTISGNAVVMLNRADISGSYTNLGSFTVLRDLVGTGTFTQGTNATFTMGEIQGNGSTQPPFTVTTFNASASGNIVDYAYGTPNGGQNQTIRVPDDGAYHHLVFSSGGGKVVSGSFDVNGNFTIQGEAWFDAGTGFTHTFYGNWVVNTTDATAFTFTTSNTIRLMTPSPSALTSISGSGTATLAFNNLELNNTGGVDLSFNASASGNLTVASGVTLTPSAAVTVGGTGTLTGGGTVVVTRTAATADFVNQYSISNRNLSALTVDYDASLAQTVNALNYFNLIVRGNRTTNDVTFAAGTVGISGTFSPLASFTSGNYVTTGNTIDFNGTTAQTVPGFNYNNLTISGSRGANNVTLSSVGTIGVASTFSPTASFGGGGYVITNSTIDFNGNGAQSVASFDYYNLSLSTNGTKTFAGGTTRIAGNFAINSPATADATTNSSTIEYNGSSSQTTPAVAYSGLTINNASGIQLSGNASVAGTLTFTTGNITTGANAISITSTGTTSRTSGHVVGNFQKYIPTGATSRTFEVGTGANYTPVDVSFASVTTAGDLTAKSTGTDHPQILGSGVEGTLSANRYWTLTNSGIVFTTYDAIFNFVAGDLDGGVDTDNFLVGLYNGSWSLPTVGTKTATSTQATGLTGFGDFQVGEPEAGGVKTWDGGASTNNWGDDDNWQPNGVPTSTDNVNLNGANTIDINVDADANSITLNHSGLVLSILSGQSLTVAGNLSMVDGTFNIAAAFPSVSGTTDITGGTIDFNASSGDQTVPALTYNNLVFSNGGTRTLASGTIEIPGTFTVSGPTVDATSNSSTVDFTGGAQTVPALNYYNLTLSNTGAKTLASGTTGIANALAFGGVATINTTTNSTTVNYNGGGAQNIPALVYHHLTLSNSGTKTFASGTTEIRGDLAVSGATANTTSNSTTITFNGGGAQSVAAINYYNITLDNAGTKTFASGTVGVANAFALAGSAVADATSNSPTISYNGSGSQSVTQIDYHHLTFTNNGTKTFAAGTTNITGNFTVNAPAAANTTSNSATIVYNGSALQSTPGITYFNATVSNAAGVQITGNATVDGTLTLSTGTITTGANKVTLSSTGTMNRIAGHVAGNLEKYLPVDNNLPPVLFEIGDATNYTPANIDFGRITAPGYLVIGTSAGDHSQILSSGIDPLLSVNRTWSIGNTGIGFNGTYTVTFTFVSGDIDGGANFNNFIVDRYNGGTWTLTGVGTRTSVSTQATNLDQFGDFQLGEASTSVLKTWDGGAGTSNWGDANNWSPDGVPMSTNNILLDGAHTININVAAVGNAITLDNASLILTILSGNSLTASNSFTLTDGTFNTEEDFVSATDTVITGGTVGYTAASGTQQVRLADYYNLTIGGGGTKVPDGNLSIANNLTISSGVFDLQSYTANRATSGGTLTISSGGELHLAASSGGQTGSNFPNNYTVFTLTGITEYNGTGAQTMANVTYGDLVLSNTGAKTIGNSFTVQGDFTVSGSTSVTINGGVTMQVNGEVNLAGGVTNNGTVNVGN